MNNETIATTFDKVASLLEVQEANIFKIRAWRDGAAQLRGMDEPVEDILEVGGRDALCAIPHIGRGLAAAIDEIVHTGRLSLLARLEGAVSPESLFETIPGIGPELAELIHRELDIDTLEDLEVAAHDGQLEAIDGIGPRRAEAIRDILAARLSRSVRRRSRRIDGLEHEDGEAAPIDVGLLLDADAEYRRQASLGNLRTIAPRRFNPRGEAWLPVMHLSRGGWELTALFSNTARAHDLGKTRDWVVIVAYQGGHEEQWTVVTERQGPMSGLRVVRGRERECERYYAGLKARGRP